MLYPIRTECYVDSSKSQFRLIKTTILETKLLRQLVLAGAVTQAAVKAVPGGFVLAVTVGMDNRLLEAQRGGARRFRTLDTAARYLHEVGLVRFVVELDGYEPGPTLI